MINCPNIKDCFRFSKEETQPAIIQNNSQVEMRPKTPQEINNQTILHV